MKFFGVETVCFNRYSIFSLVKEEELQLSKWTFCATRLPSLSYFLKTKILLTFIVFIVCFCSIVVNESDNQPPALANCSGSSSNPTAFLFSNAFCFSINYCKQSWSENTLLFTVYKFFCIFLCGKVWKLKFSRYID